MVILRTEKAIISAMCGVKLIEKMRSQELKNSLGLEETLYTLAKVNRVRWHRHVLMRMILC